MRNNGSIQERQFTSLELFAGAGGLALGVHGAGFKHLGLIERDHFAADTLRENCENLLDMSPDMIIEEDASLVDYKRFQGVDLLTGGPPCQPFSTAGRNKGHADSRNMFPTFINAIRTIMPKSIIIENVKGLCRTVFNDYLQYLLLSIKFPLLSNNEESWQDHYLRLQSVKAEDFNIDEIYNVGLQLVDAADFGIPQRRQRVIITAFRQDLSIEPVILEKTHSKEALFIDQWITGSYWERYKIEPINYLTKQDTRIVEKLRTILPNIGSMKPWKTVRDAIFDLPIPVNRGQKELFSNHVQVPGARTYPCHTGIFYDYPSKALKAGTHGTPGGENCVIEPSSNDVRYFTTREAARLQNFPDKWHFHGTWGACIKQLGNAVPVDLIKQFAAEIYSRLEQQDTTKNLNYERDSRYYSTSTYSPSFG